MAFNLTAIMQLPITSPPPGVHATFQVMESTTRGMNASAGICSILGMLTFIMSIYTRIRVVRRFVLEDYLFVLCQCGFIIFMVTNFYTIHRGVYHDWDIRIKDISFYLYWDRLVEAIYTATIALVKVVILLQFLRIFVPSKAGVIYWISTIYIWVNVAFGIAGIFVCIFKCTPIRKAWDPLLLVSKEGSCIHFNAALIFSGTFTLIQDFVLFFIPQYTIWRLHMARSQKIGVSALFGLGFMACTASIMKLVYVVKLTKQVDQVPLTFWVGFWSGIELTFGIMIISVPSAPRFYKHLRDDLHLASTVKRYLISSRASLSSSGREIVESKPSSSDGFVNTSGKSYPKRLQGFVIEHHEKTDSSTVSV